jgi:hypothetical protein
MVMPLSGSYLRKRERTYLGYDIGIMALKALLVSGISKIL